MTTQAGIRPTVTRTERGLVIAGTHITLYDLMDYVTAGWPPNLIRDRLGLTDEQAEDAIAYIQANRAEVEAEYQHVLRTAEQNRRYWEERNRERLSGTPPSPPDPDQEALRARLAAW